MKQALIFTKAMLRSSGLKVEREGLIITAQDQCLPTNTDKAKINKNGLNTASRLRDKFDETVDHIISVTSPEKKILYQT